MSPSSLRARPVPPRRLSLTAGSGPSARLRRSTNQAIDGTGTTDPNESAWKDVEFDTDDWNHGHIFNAAVSASKARVLVTPGHYSVSARAKWQVGSTGGITVHMRLLHFDANGTQTEIARVTHRTDATTVNLVTEISDAVSVRTNEYLKLQVQHDYGLPRDVISEGKFSPVLQLTWVRELVV